jgi:hypothetical protein
MVSNLLGIEFVRIRSVEFVVTRAYDFTASPAPMRILLSLITLSFLSRAAPKEWNLGFWLLVLFNAKTSQEGPH